MQTVDQQLVAVWNAKYPLRAVKRIEQIERIGKQLAAKTDAEKVSILAAWTASLNTKPTYDRTGDRMERRTIERQYRITKDLARGERTPY